MMNCDATQGHNVKKDDVPIVTFDYSVPLADQFVKNKSEVKRKPCCRFCPEPKPAPLNPEIPITRLLGMLDPKWRWAMVGGSIFSAAQGVVFPAFSVLFGQLFNLFSGHTTDEIRSGSVIVAALFVGLAVYNLITGYASQMLWGMVGEAVDTHFRRRYFEALLRQEVGFYDTQRLGSIVTVLHTNIDSLRSGTGIAVAIWMMFASQCLVGIIIAFVYGWKLTLVLVALSPLVALGGVLQMRLLASSTEKETETFKSATNLAVECIASIGTVVSFNWEEEARTRYFVQLDKTRKPRVMAVHLAGLAWGASFFFMLAVFSLGFWYGAQLVADGIPPAGSTYPPGYVMPSGMAMGDMLIVFVSIMMGAMGLGQMVSLNLEFAACRANAHAVISLIERVPLIDGRPEAPGEAAPNIQGDVQLRNLRFQFPSRHEEVIKGINLKIPAGTIVGIVGSSGAGKSTLIQLIERFYDVTSGAVLIDGKDIKEYNIYSLRKKIGLVSQEPLLFDLTIADNIRFGKLDATDEEVIEASKKANAHNFIMTLPAQYDTMCGEGGGALSGGQKQRIAIARAMLQDPRILLLDEATSALDAESERLVQVALSRLMKGRTTIVVAHRLSTIRDSHMIVVMDKGEVVEQGTHRELLLRRKHYYSLVARQLDQAELLDLTREANARNLELLRADPSLK